MTDNKGKIPDEPAEVQVAEPEPGQGTIPDTSKKEPDKYSGKTQEELVAMLQDSDLQLKQKAAREKELQDNITVLRESREQPQQPSIQGFQDNSTPQPEPEQPEPKETVPGLGVGDYANVGETERMIEQKLAESRKTQQKETQNRLQTAAGIAYEEGKQTMRGKPIFKGIEDDVGKTIVSQFLPYSKQGYDVSNYLRDPGVWERAAKVVLFQQEKYELLQASKSTPANVPMTTATGQTPNATKEVPTQQESAIEIDEKSRFLMGELDLTEEEAKKGVISGRRHARGED